VEASAVGTVEDHMSKEVFTVGPDMDAYAAINLLLAHHVSALPVLDNDGDLIGILSERACLEALVRAEYYESPPALVKDLMTTDVITVDHNTDILNVAALFSEQKFHHFPVLENGRLVGQISRRGIIRAIQGLLASKREGRQ